MKATQFFLLGLMSVLFSLAYSQDVSCGDSSTTYKTEDTGLVCIYFSWMGENGRKVVYAPVVDQFEAFQIKGLYDIISGIITNNGSDPATYEGNFTMQAFSNGIASRRVVFKHDAYVAPLVHLRVTLESGAVKSLDWLNSCYDDQCCTWNNCIDTTLPEMSALNQTERNCMIYGCTSSTSDPKCDTQVYVSWKGTDSQGRICQSDNLRISGMSNFGIKSYVSSAESLPNVTYNQPLTQSTTSTTSQSAAEILQQALEQR